ncbi:MAG: outer membrane protein assembly factor [Candidatus Zixiibacteriota bacterium]
MNLVSIVGNQKTKDKVIRRELSVYPGQIFHRSLLMRSMRDAMALNYFSNVVPDVKDLPNGDVDVEITVEEKQTGQLNAGAGYSARDRLVGTFGMGIPNLFGNGQTLNFNIEFGGRRNSSQISFTEPWMFGRPTLRGTDIFRLNREFVNIYTEGRRGGSIRFGKRLRWPDNFFRASFTYRLEGNRFFDFSNDFVFANRFHSVTTTDSTFTHFDDSGFIVNSNTIVVDTSIDGNPPKPGSLLELDEGWNTASILSFTLNRDSRNLPEFATSGSRFRYTYSKAGDFLGGFWDYTKHFTEFTQFINLYKGIALAAKFQFGAIIGSNDIKVLESERFAPGGTSFLGIVRGYDDGSLTPDRLIGGDTAISRTVVYDTTSGTPTLVTTDSTESSQRPLPTRVRGKFMLTTNWEISFPLARNSLYFLTFFDAGNSWLKFQNIKPINGLFPGVGVGFRLAVPGIGTIGFDFGKPLRRRIFYDGLGNLTSDGLGWHSHFQVGTVFR